METNTINHQCKCPFCGEEYGHQCKPTSGHKDGCAVFKSAKCDCRMSNGETSKRKMFPVVSGVLDYFPDALLAIARLSQVGNDQHNPGKPLHWDRSKSGDEADALARHLIERGQIDTDGIRHSAKVAWRALALLQKELEEAYKLQPSRGSK